MNRKAVIFAVIGVLVIGVPLAGKFTQRGSEKIVDIAAVERQAIRSSILASGALAYRDQVELRSEVIGKVASVDADEGDRVAAGDVVIALDPDQFRAQVEQQQANVRMQEIAIERQQVLLENLERSVQRQRDLFGRGLLDSNAFEAAENELALARVDLRTRQEALAQARATLAQAQDNLARTMIRSPIDGVVIMLDVKPGEAVITGTTNIPGTTLARVADPAVLLAEVQVDETDIALVEVGQQASIFSAAQPDRALSGVVETIARSAQRAQNQQNLSFEVRIRVDPGDGAFARPGMSCRAEIYTETSDDTLAVPLQAVLYDEEVEGDAEQPYVFVVDGGQARRRDVQVGLSSDSHIEVTDGVSAGEQVVSGPFRELRHLRDGDRVAPQGPDERD